MSIVINEESEVVFVSEPQEIGEVQGNDVAAAIIEYLEEKIGRTLADGEFELGVSLSPSNAIAVNLLSPGVRIVFRSTQTEEIDI